MISTAYSGISQNFGKELTLQVQLEKTPNGAKLSWEENTSTEVIIYKKLIDEKEWSTLATLQGVTTYEDIDVTPNYCYEYKIEADFSAVVDAPYNLSYGYALLDQRESVVLNRKSILVLVESNIALGLTRELEILRQDLFLDGYNPYITPVDKELKAPQVKRLVKDYHDYQGVKYLYIIGNIAVPYSGFHAPDGHNDHLGAWPADGFYADLNDELWTEHPFFSFTNERDPRNSNLINDGKYDQSIFPSEVELVVSRIDFSSLPSFDNTELELTKNYLQNASARKHGMLVDNGKALVEDSLMHEVDGFGNNLYRNFDPIIGRENIIEGELLKDLPLQNYLTSFAASYADDTSAFSIASTRDLAQTTTNAIFKLLMGSYFGDWDTPDNFMRANLASGNTLNVMWTGRPNYFLHQLAANRSIGDCFRMSCNNGIGSTAEYAPKGSNANNTAMSLMGDPTIRLSYNNVLSSFSATEGDSMVLLAWNFDPTANVKGIVISKFDSLTNTYKILTTLPAQATKYYDVAAHKGTYEYIINPFYEENAYSTPYLNYSFGTSTSIQVNLQKKAVSYPTSFLLTASTIFDKLVQLKVELSTKDSGNYSIYLERKRGAEDWNEIGVEDFYKPQTVEVEYQNYFFDTLQSNIETYYRAKYIFKDTTVYSNDTALLLEHISSAINIYPNPCYTGQLYITGDTIKSSDISVFNTTGAKQYVRYNEDLGMLDFRGFRKGLYLLSIRNKIIKVNLVH